MLRLFHVHIYLAVVNVCVGVAFPPFLIPFRPACINIPYDPRVT